MTKTDVFLDNASVIIVFLVMVLGGSYVLAGLLTTVSAALWSVVSGHSITDFSYLMVSWLCLTLTTVTVYCIRDYRRFELNRAERNNP